MDWMDVGVEPSYGSMEQIQELSGEQIHAPAIPRPWLWKPGQSGNPAGRPTRASQAATQAVTKAQARAMAAALYPEAWEKWQEAIEGGQSWAIQMAVQYELGKPTERHEVSGADGGPIEHVVRDTRQTIDAFIAEWREVPAEEASDAVHQQDRGNEASIRDGAEKAVR